MGPGPDDVSLHCLEPVDTVAVDEAGPLTALARLHAVGSAYLVYACSEPGQFRTALRRPEGGSYQNAARYVVLGETLDGLVGGSSRYRRLTSLAGHDDVGA